MRKEWKPIETAPKNIPILVYDPNNIPYPYIGVAEYLVTFEALSPWSFTWDKEDLFDLRPLYWMHLPEIPSKNELLEV